MKKLAIALGSLLLLFAIFAGYKVFDSNTVELRAKRMIVSLICDPEIQKRIQQEYNKKRSVEDVSTLVSSGKQAVWAWAAGKVGQFMLRERVKIQTLRTLLGKNSLHFPSLSKEIYRLAKKKCALRVQTPSERFKVAMVWEMVASYAGIPSPIRCLRCMIPESKRVALLGEMERKIPFVQKNTLSFKTISARKKHLVRVATLKALQKRSWLFRKFVVPSESAKLPYMKSILQATETLEKKKLSIVHLLERGQASMLVGQLKDGVRDLKTVTTLCKMRMHVAMFNIDTYYYWAMAHASLAEYELAIRRIQDAIRLANHLGQAGRIPMFKTLLQAYKANQKALQKLEKL